jgi:hypothetical protein
MCRKRLGSPMISVALGLALLRGSVATYAAPARLLFGFHDASWSRAREMTRGLGEVVLKVSPGMYALDLRPAVSERAVRRALTSRHAKVFPWSTLNVKRNSLNSVQAYLRYLESAEDFAGTKCEGTDFYEALKHFLRYRAGADGVIDPEQLRTATVKRNLMRPAGWATGGARIASARWEFIGPRNLDAPYRIFFGNGPLSGRVTCAATDPTNSKIIYVGTGGGGIWKTSDGGSNWACITDKSPWLYGAVNAIAIDRANPKIIYAGTGDYDGFYNAYCQGIMKSVDGGVTWANYGDAEFGGETVSGIIVGNPSNNVTVTTGHGKSYFGGHIWHSTDSGQTWTVVVGQEAAWNSLIYSDVSGEYKAAGPAFNGIYLYHSFDGVTWHQTTSPVTNEDNAVCLAPSHRNAGDTDFYVFCPVNQALFVNGDPGLPINLVASPPFNGANSTNWKFCTYDYVLGSMLWVDPQNVHHDALFIGLNTLAEGIFDLDAQGHPTAKWSDIGLSYQTNAILHSDQHVISGNLFGNDGGLFRATQSPTTGGVSFTSLNAQLGTTQFYKIAPHPSDPSKIIGGTQDNASPAALGDLTHWSNLEGGDGGFCAWDVVHNLHYTTGTNGTVYSYDAAGNKTVIAGTWADRHNFTSPLVLDNSGTPLFGTYRVQRYSGTPGIWTAISPDLTDGLYNLTTMATTPANDGILYTGSDDGRIYLTTNLQDAAPTWRRIDNSALPGGAPVGAISPNPLNPHEVLVGTGGAALFHTGGGYFYECPDTSVSSPRWYQFAFGGQDQLPFVPINAIERSPSDPNSTWFVATDIGVFMTTDAGVHWSNATGPLGLPNTIVMDLKVGAGFLYAGTFGRGIWRIPLPNSAVLQAITLSSLAAPGGHNVAGNVTIGSAQNSSIAVAMASSNTAVASVLDTSVPSGSVYGSFMVFTQPVASDTPVTISASLNGITKSAVLTVKAPVLSSLASSPNPVVGGLTSDGLATLATKAASAGAVVKLSSSTSLAVVPASATVPGDGTQAKFTIKTSPVSQVESVTLTATLNGSSKTETLEIDPAPLASISLSSPVVGGNTASGAVSLNSAAPAGGLPVNLSSNDADAIPSPKSFTIPAGATSKSIGVVTRGVVGEKTVTITAVSEAVSRSTTLVIDPAGVQSLTLLPSSTRGGIRVTATATLNGVAPSGGAVLALSTSNTSVATVPSSATVPYGAHSISFAVVTKGVASTTTVNVNTVYRALTKTAALTLSPAVLLSLAPDSALVGGNTVLEKATLLGNAPPSGAVITLRSSNPAVVAVPSSVTVPTNHSVAGFLITTNGVSATTSVVIYAAYLGVTRTCKVTVSPAKLLSLTLSSSTVTGGTSVKATLTLDGKAPPNGLTVSLASNSTYAKVPPTVAFTANAKTASFTVSTTHPTATQSATISATASGVSKSAVLTINP